MQMHEKRWPMFNRVLEQAQRMDRVMDRLGVDPVFAARQDHGKAFARARAVCLVCPFAEACKEWLRHGGDACEPPGYCPNSAFFASFRRGHVAVRHDH